MVLISCGLCSVLLLCELSVYNLLIIFLPREKKSHHLGQPGPYQHDHNWGDLWCGAYFAHSIDHPPSQAATQKVPFETGRIRPCSVAWAPWATTLWAVCSEEHGVCWGIPWAVSLILQVCSWTPLWLSGIQRQPHGPEPVCPHWDSQQPMQEHRGDEAQPLTWGHRGMWARRWAGGLEHGGAVMEECQWAWAFSPLAMISKIVPDCAQKTDAMAEQRSFHQVCYNIFWELPWTNIEICHLII